MPRPSLALLRTLPRLGPGRLKRYAAHRMRLSSGYYEQRQPMRPWPEPDPSIVAGARSPWSAPDPAALKAVAADQASAVAAAERVLAGEAEYFGWAWLPRPPDWQTHPQTGHRPAPAHWSHVADLPSPDQGDIKWIWEPSRFRGVQQLVRAAALTGDDRFAEGAWDLIASWREHNPPNAGANWKCGQECAIRLMVLVQTAGLLPSLGDDRRALLWSTVATLAERIEVAIGYAVSQRNNHGLAEAVGLELTGFCLPNHPRASEWRALGRELFVEQALDQWDEEGWWLGNAYNYTRKALRYGLVAALAGRAFGDPLPDEVLRRLAMAGRWLWQHQDPVTGQLPNQGANDGSRLFSNHACAFGDFRPTLQLCAWLCEGKRLYAAGPWDEELLWEAGEVPPNEALDPTPRAAFYTGRRAGAFVLRGDRSFATMRCYRHVGRPSHADMLHVDLWWEGRNVLADGGSFQYNEPSGWGLHLKGTCGHNLLEVNEHSQMPQASTFLYVDWADGHLLGSGRVVPGWDGRGVEGQQNGYVGPDGVVHRRLVLRRGDAYLIVDDGIADDGTAWRGALRWHLGDGADWREVDGGGAFAVEADGVTLWCLGPPGSEADLRVGEEHLPDTGRSVTYGQILPRAVVRSRHGSAGSARWITAVGSAVPTIDGDVVRWEGLEIPIAPDRHPRAAG